MKRTLALLLALVMMLALLAACGENKGGAADMPGEDETETTPPPPAKDDEPETTPPIMPVPDTPAPADPPASAGVDLTAFYGAVTANYEMNAMENISGSDLMDDLYAGLSGISTRQSLVCVVMMTGVVREIVLIEVSDAADVETVKGILQARIDAQASGGAWYPDTVDGWKNDSRIVSNGNYIMMVVHQDSDSIVSDFNALF